MATPIIAARNTSRFDLSATSEQSRGLDQENQNENRIVDGQREARIDEISTHLFSDAQQQTGGDGASHPAGAADDDDDQRLQGIDDARRSAAGDERADQRAGNGD